MLDEVGSESEDDTALREIYPPFNFNDFPYTCTYSRDGRYFAVAHGIYIYLYYARSRALVKIFEHYQNEVRSMDFNPNGTQLAFTNSNYRNDYDYSVKIWFLQTDDVKEMRNSGHYHTLYRVAYNQDGSLLAASSRDKVTLWTAGGTLLHTLENENGDTQFVFSWGYEGKHLGTARVGNNKIKIHAADTGTLLKELSIESPIRSFSFSPVGMELAIGTADNAILLWGNEKIMSLWGHTSRVEILAFSRDGKNLATADSNGAINIWSLERGELEQTLEGHRKGVTGLAWRPDEEEFISVGQDKTMRIWGKNIPLSPSTLPATSVAPAVVNLFKIYQNRILAGRLEENYIGNRQSVSVLRVQEEENANDRGHHGFCPIL